jgi:hypothetical protein
MRNRTLRESTEERDTQAQELAANDHSEDDSSDNNDDDDLTLFESLAPGPELCKHVEKVSDFLDKVKKGYKEDDMFSKIIKEPVMNIYSFLIFLLSITRPSMC